MKLGFPETQFTPREASFIRRSLNSGGLEGELRERVKLATRDWALAVAPPEMISEWQKIAGAQSEFMVTGLMLAQFDNEAQEEAITIDLDIVDLTVVRSAARYTLEFAQQKTQEADSLITNEVSDGSLETFISFEFEEALNDIQMGHFIIGAINTYFPE